MSTIADVLEFKFPNVSGIRTRDDDSGGTEIFDWPGPGPMPNAQQIAAWQIEFDNRPTLADPIQGATTLTELKDALVGRVTPWRGR